MIRRLRLKFVAVCMALVTAVLAAVLGAVLGAVRENISDLSGQVLQRVIQEEPSAGRGVRILASGSAGTGYSCPTSPSISGPAGPGLTPPTSPAAPTPIWRIRRN